MHKSIDKSTHPLTPELAKWLSSLPTFPGDRKRDSAAGRNRIEYLKSQLLDGKFHGPDWAVAYLDGTEYRMNGGHSSQMLCECNGSFPKGLKVSIEKFHCDTMEDMAELFGTFDPPQSVRTIGDQINAHSKIHESISELSTTHVRTAIAGISTALFLTEGRKVSNDEKLRMIHSHQEFIIWSSPFIMKALYRAAGTVGAMYLTYRKNDEAAFDFWSAVRDESDPSPSHPTRKLATFLRDNVGKKTKWNAKAYLVKALHAWNAYRRNTTTDLKFSPDYPVPPVA